MSVRLRHGRTHEEERAVGDTFVLTANGNVQCVHATLSGAKQCAQSRGWGIDDAKPCDGRWRELVPGCHSASPGLTIYTRKVEA